MVNLAYGADKSGTEGCYSQLGLQHWTRQRSSKPASVSSSLCLGPQAQKHREVHGVFFSKHYFYCSSPVDLAKLMLRACIIRNRL